MVDPIHGTEIEEEGLRQMGNMKIKIASVETRQDKNGKDYAVAQGDVLKQDGTVIQGRTIMAFGDQFASVRKFLRAKRTVTVSAVFDGGVIKVLGPQKETKAKATA